MVRGSAPRLAFGLLFAGASRGESGDFEPYAGSGFMPFAGLEELKPQPLEAFCEREASSSDGLRWCQHSVRKTLEDGGDVEFSWRMHADPDSILSLDSEAAHGVRLRRCGQNDLEIEVPESHVRRAERGKIVVGSRFVHNCDHLVQRHLYHRITEVRKHEWRSGSDADAGGQRMARLHLSTEELPNFAHAVRFLSFHFSYMPVEARDFVKFPEMRTDFGLNRDALARDQQLKERRLGLSSTFLNGIEKLGGAKGVETDKGGFRSGGKGTGSINTENSIINFVPKQVSNFGWNWNFNMNTTEEPNFNITGPGLKGVFKVRKPYIKVHAGIFLNFTSEFSGVTKAPKVNWHAGLNGHGIVQARILAVLNTTGDAGADPYDLFNSPTMEKLRTPQWFQKIDFATGSMPISMEPGFQFKAQMYHQGPFHGAVAFGGSTHGTINPLLKFDSLTGFDADFSGELLDTSFWPPMWMIFTKSFEMGIQLEPSILMRGDFAGLEKATTALEMKPYLNITVMREGTSSYIAEDTKTLTVYPFRVMGLAASEFNQKYKVKISVNGQEFQTSPEMNWGQVQFHDHVSTFNVGSVTQAAVTGDSIQVTLIEVDTSSPNVTEKVLGTGTVRCTSLLNGECHPSPNIAKITSGSTEVGDVELAIVWKENPQPWFASKIRGVGVSFPQVVLREDALRTTFPNAVQTNFTQGSNSLVIHLVVGGITYLAPITGDASSQQTPLSSTVEIQFGPSFLEMWAPCSTTSSEKCTSPRLELYYGTTQVAVANIPQIEWTSQTAMQGTKGNFMASSGGSGLNVPVTCALFAPGSTMATIAIVKMNAHVVEPALSSLFLQPTGETEVGLGASQAFTWTIADVDTRQEYAFTMAPLKLLSTTPTNMQTYINYAKVSGKALQPVAGQSKQFTAKCQQAAIAGMEASDAPCSFSNTFSFSSGYTVGDEVVVMVTWNADGVDHQSFSPQFQIVAKAPGRRLVEMARNSPRRLFSVDAWNARVDQHAESCEAKNLKFNLGAGMLFRGRVDNVGVPKGFPMIGGLDEQPELTTGYRKVAFVKPGTEASDLLPQALCKGGLCTGALPGCAKVNTKKMYFPRLLFNFNRPMHYKENKGKFHGTIKTMLAYAFSTLPEMVDVMIKEMNETHPGGTTTAKPAVPGWDNAVADLERDVGSYPAAKPTPAQPSHKQAATAAVQEGEDFFHKFWSPGVDHRRLSANVEQAPTERLPSELQEHQVAVRFKQGLAYPVDRPLVERMLNNGYFWEIEDDAVREHGALEITSFYLDRTHAVPIEDDTPNSALPASWFLPLLGGASTRGLVVFACAAVACVAGLLVVAKRDRRYLQQAYAEDNEDQSDGPGLE